MNESRFVIEAERIYDAGTFRESRGWHRVGADHRSLNSALAQVPALRGYGIAGRLRVREVFSTGRRVVVWKA